MKKVLSLIFIFSLLIINVNCKKDSSNGGGPAETEVPSLIVFTTPIAGAIVLNGSILKVEGEITDNNNLSAANVVIKNKATGAILFQQLATTGTVSFYRFLWNWTVTGVTSTITATIRVTAKDKLNNEVFKEIEVSIIP